jgi:hypothetical protein
LVDIRTSVDRFGLEVSHLLHRESELRLILALEPGRELRNTDIMVEEGESPGGICRAGSEVFARVYRFELLCGGGGEFVHVGVVVTKVSRLVAVGSD